VCNKIQQHLRRVLGRQNHADAKPRRSLARAGTASMVKGCTDACAGRQSNFRRNV